MLGIEHDTNKLLEEKHLNEEGDGRQAVIDEGDRAFDDNKLQGNDSKTGRKRKYVWLYFELAEVEESKYAQAKCIFCNKIMSGVASRMETHLISVCTMIPNKVRQEFIIRHRTNRNLNDAAGSGQNFENELHNTADFYISAEASRSRKSTSQQILNDPTNAVDDMLHGLVKSSSQLVLVQDQKVVLHRSFERIKMNQVTLISGGGSGHEPAHAGYIGDNMLTGVVCGDVFASPTTAQVLAAIRLVAGPKGCLVIVKNYTGDRINFGLAIETANSEGYNVEMVVVGDDVALIDNQRAGRRGLAGVVLVHKISGAMASQGYPMAKIIEHIKYITDNLGTMGVATKVCTLPGKVTVNRIHENEMELGLGIHGEPGVKKCSLMSSIETVKVILDKITGKNGLHLINGDRVVLIVNNLGSTPTLELSIVANDAINYLVRRGIQVERSMVGSFMTALDMSGVSLTIWKLTSSVASFQLEYFDHNVSASGWPRMSYCNGHNNFDEKIVQPAKAPKQDDNTARPETLSVQGQIMENCILEAMNRIILAEPELTEWDTKVGDGDCGTTLKSGAEAIQQDLKSHYPLNSPSKTLHAIANSIGNSIGGTSGVLYNVFFTSAGNCMAKYDRGSALSENIVQAWLESFESGISAIQKYGGAQEGSRTMLDALLPSLRAFNANFDLSTTGLSSKGDGNVQKAFLAAAIASREGAENTKNILAKDAFGRSGYIGDEFCKNIPDPGAMAVSIWINAIQNELMN